MIIKDFFPILLYKEMCFLMATQIFKSKKNFIWVYIFFLKQTNVWPVKHWPQSRLDDRNKIQRFNYLTTYEHLHPKLNNLSKYYNCRIQSSSWSLEFLSTLLKARWIRENVISTIFLVWWPTRGKPQVSLPKPSITFYGS